MFVAQNRALCGIFNVIGAKRLPHSEYSCCLRAQTTQRSLRCCPKMPQRIIVIYRLIGHVTLHVEYVEGLAEDGKVLGCW